MLSPANHTPAILIFRRLLLSIIKGGANIIRSFGGYLHRLFVWLKTRWNKPKPSGGSTGSDDTAHESKTTTPYTIVKNGETISMNGISTSLYPFSNGNIRNTSRASVRSSHNPSLQSRNASRSSRRPGSLMSRRSAASSFYDLANPDATTRRPLPLPQRQMSASMPHLHAETDLDREGSIDIKVTSPISPGNHSTTSLNIPSNLDNLQPPRPRPLPDDLNIETVDSPTNYEQTTFEIPPSPVSTNTHDHSRSTIEHGVHSLSSSRAPSRISRTGQSSIDPEPRDIRPAFPSETQRYHRQTKLPKVHTNLTFPPITLDYSNPAPPDGWERYAHPEGCRYFYNKSLRVYTDAEIYDPVILEHLQADIAHLKAVSATFPKPFPPTGEFVINVYRNQQPKEERTAPDDKIDTSDELISEYYCVDHDTRLIVFLKDFRADWMDAWHEAQGVRSAFQLQSELLAQYWYFVQLYPSAIKLDGDMIRDLRDIVLHLIGDSSTSPFSTACHPLDTLYKILSLTRELERNIGPGAAHGSMCLLARHMYIFNHSRFLNFHGESSARIERDFSIYDDKSLWRRSLLIKTLSFVLFSAPEVHLKNLHKMWVDGMMHKAVWEETMKRLSDEWQEFIFFATVVLNANVAFLAIQSVDVNQNPYRSPAQISSYLSVVANIASIILGLLLMRQNRTKNRETADDVQKFLTDRNHPRLGLESLAILYSLPYALLMWGMIAFLAAFAFTWFQDSNPSTRSLVGSSCCAMTILIVWCIYVSWENKDTTEPPGRPFAYQHPDDKCEDVGDIDDDLAPKEEVRSVGEIRNSLVMRLLGRFFRIPVPFKSRRASYDSEKTAVTPVDV